MSHPSVGYCKELSEFPILWPRLLSKNVVSYTSNIPQNNTGNDLGMGVISLYICIDIHIHMVRSE